MATDSARSATDSVRSAKRMDMVKTAIYWLLKFVRYIILNVFIGTLLDNYIFVPMETVIFRMLEEDEEVEDRVGGRGAGGSGEGGLGGNKTSGAGD